jgi:hypothetical protein
MNVKQNMILAGLVAVTMLTATALAQPAPGAGRNPAAAPAIANRQAQVKQLQLDFVKTKLEMSDDDWKAFEPKLIKVLEAKRNAQTGAGMQMMFFNGAPQVRAAIDVVGAFSSDPLTAMRDLKDSTENSDAKDEELSAKMAALREARDKAKADLEAAQKELQTGLTARQQAVLMVLGILD